MQVCLRSRFISVLAAYLVLGSQIYSSLLPSESLSPALRTTLTLIRRSRFVRSLYRIWGYVIGRPQPEAPDVLIRKTIVEERELVMRRDALREEWHQKWNSQGLDFVLTVTHPFPALAHGDGVKASLMSASYTFLFNMVCLSSLLHGSSILISPQLA